MSRHVGTSDILAGQDLTTAVTAIYWRSPRAISGRHHKSIEENGRIHMTSRSWIVGVLALAFSAWSAPAIAQVDRASVTGTVRDASQARDARGDRHPEAHRDQQHRRRW